MTSKIIVNNIEADSGISSITFNDSIFIGDINSTGTSTFNVVSGVSTIGVTTVHLTGINDLNYPTSGPLSNRNLIVNGAMMVSQRSTSLTGQTGGGYKCLDRFRIGKVNLGTWTFTQSDDAPVGFSSSFKCECTTAAALPAAGDLFNIQHRMEGQELQVLKKGTSSAENFTVSFWVKSNKTGTYNLQAEDLDNNRSNVRQYSIESSNTWEYKTLTFDGDTTGSLDKDVEQSFRLIWWLGSGTNYSSGTTPSTWEAVNATNNAVGNVNLADSTSNVFYITGVQMETGSVATPFEHRSYGYELARCQRYYEIIAHWYGGSNSYGTIWSKPLNTFTNCWTDVRFKVTKRAPNYNFGLLGSTVWAGTTPDVHNDAVDAIVFQAGGHYYLNGGSSIARDMAYVESEL